MFRMCALATTSRGGGAPGDAALPALEWMLARPEVACREVPCGIDWRLLGTSILCRLRQHEASGDVVASAEAAPAERNPILLRLLVDLGGASREPGRRVRRENHDLPYA
eukprot:jgi/Tetstr1/450235/TSEL_037273.t1